ncbi:septum site-determining protein MinC [Lutispora thermophila]|uniref:Probable septum site-determining protein MinC n=1 Tax=Lutispora thermophila DSM 19022 TaxID=1122184 RepID=A0A1M6FSS2_9FIRM|nr:septum site-determining protein MinC [Lutispora thermophila]SHJ00700.1 septum site-determining protein MinC [Lutispora thermophila DSM 19022]
MKDDAIVFKGTKEGLYIVLKEEMIFDDIVHELENKIKPSKRFFEGAKIVNFKGKSLTPGEYEELVDILQNQYGMQFLGDYESLCRNDVFPKEDQKDQPIPEPVKQPLGDEEKALFIKGTIRSGQLIKFDGNIVVLGDVNPGAYLEATGSIIVMGNMRGTAHSGTQGDYSTYIAAYKMEPMQLRIGDIINRPPDEKKYKSEVPEMAVVKQGMIIVEPYLVKK